MMASAMFKKEVTAGETVIKQGDDGDNFYLIGSGEMEVFVQRDPDSEPAKVLQLAAGGTFGELALMYQSPRAATVIAMNDCVLWCLDRIQFKALCSGAEQQQTNEEWLAFLEKVEVLPICAKSLSGHQICENRWNHAFSHHNDNFGSRNSHCGC